MCTTERIIDYKNLNGYGISLKVEKRNHNPMSQRFVISFKNNKQNISSWALKSLVFAIIFNVITMTYIRISFTATMIIIIVMLFLIYFWMTHSVQSETLLVTPLVGIQSSVKYVVGRTHVFYPWNDIDDIIIDEGITFKRIYYVLMIILIGRGEMKCFKFMGLFEFTKPRLMMLEVIYSEIRSLLIASKDTPLESGSGDIN